MYRNNQILTARESFNSLKTKIKKEVQNELLKRAYMSDDDTIKLIDRHIREIGHEIHIDINDKIRLRKEIFNAIRKLDVLQEFLDDDTVSEIMVNGTDNIFVERNGRLEKTDKFFDSEEQLFSIIQKISSYANREVTVSNPISDGRLSDGSRVNVVLSPISLEGHILTIRRFPNEPMNANKLIESGAVTEEIMELLSRLVSAGYNILISGSTGSGKTTMLNALSGFIPKDERIVTIEDAAELKIIGIENLVRLETRNSNMSDSKEVTMRDLIKAALRMRPDRVVVGEVRGAEAIDMLQAFCVGQDGSMSTIHANSAKDALTRLEMLLLLNMDIPLKALRKQISSGVDIVIQLSRLKDKSRKITEIVEVLGSDDNDYVVNPLYRFENDSFIKISDIKSIYKLEKAGI